MLIKLLVAIWEMFRQQMYKLYIAVGHQAIGLGGGQIRHIETLVSTAWLGDNLKKSGDKLKVVHASYENCKDYDNGHIPGSVCFDGQHCRDQKSPYKFMLPKPEEFAEYVGKKLGIDNDTDVVVYDSNDATPMVMYAVRVWYMFRVFGHDRVSLLNGGMKRWKAENREVTTEKPQITPKTFISKFRKDLVLSYEDVVAKVVKNKQLQLVDARSRERFSGTGEDPYGKSGHIPNALNVPVSLLTDPKKGLFRSKNELEKIFKDGGVDLARPAATSCGAGMTASGLAFGAFMLGKELPVYDGSWFEWVRRAPDEYIVKEK